MTDYTAPLTNEQLILEVATGKLAFANKVKLPSVKALWEGIARFTAESLRSQKGVLLPNLGNFTVGPVVGESQSKKRIRPVFALLEGRYGTVSQERSRYAIGGHMPIVQPSYSRLATAAVVHRGVCQRLVADLLQRLGAYIVSGRPIRIEFAELGRLFTNRAGRIEFVFEPLFMEFFDQELRERMPTDADDDNESLRSGLSRVALDSPYGSRPATGASRPASAASSMRPGSAVPQGQLQPPRVVVALREGRDGGPHGAGLQELWQFCRVVDKVNCGAVSRVKLEQWLLSEGRPLVDPLDGTAMLDLFTHSTYAKNEKYILYNRFVDNLEDALPQPGFDDHNGVPDAPIHELPYYGEDANSGYTPRGAWGGDQQQQPAGPSGYHNQPPSPYGQQAGQSPPYGQQHQQGRSPPYGQPPSPYGQSPSPYGQQQPPPGYPPPYGQQPSTPGAAQGNGYGQHGGAPGFAAQQAWAAPQAGRPPAVLVPGTPRDSGAGAVSRPALADPEDYMHYYQGELSPRSRKEYDMFNRMHFDRLAQARGGDKRAVTPKVGMEPLNMQEYRAVQNSAPPATGNNRLPSPFGRAPPSAQPASEGRPPQRPQVFHVRQEDYASSPIGTPAASRPGAYHQSARSLASPSTKVSQYDIINEHDPVSKQRLKTALARELQQQYAGQIREKQVAADSVLAAERQWPFANTHQSHDRRPISRASPSPQRR